MLGCVECKDDSCHLYGTETNTRCDDFTSVRVEDPTSITSLQRDLAILQDQYEELLAERDGFRDRYITALRELESYKGKVQGIRDILSVEPRR